jgi:dihydroanticapsin dehydrogenase
MSYQLEGKKALVTGGASGIGKAVVELFVRVGARVAFCDVDTKNGQALAARLGEACTRFFPADVANMSDVENMVQHATGWLGGLDVLVNNAGVGGIGLPSLLEDLSPETWDRTINTNLRGTYQVSKFALPHMKARGGAVVNVVSTYSIVGGPQLGAYCASKGGILALSRNMALDYAPHRVRVNAIAPGFVDTPMLRNDIAKDPDPGKTLASILERLPQAELMTPEQVAKVILFLCSDDSAIMTGSLVVADGGYTAR